MRQFHEGISSKTFKNNSSSLRPSTVLMVLAFGLLVSAIQ